MWMFQSEVFQKNLHKIFILFFSLTCMFKSSFIFVTKKEIRVIYLFVSEISTMLTNKSLQNQCKSFCNRFIGTKKNAKYFISTVLSI